MIDKIKQAICDEISQEPRIVSYDITCVVVYLTNLHWRQI